MKSLMVHVEYKIPHLLVLSLSRFAMFCAVQGHGITRVVKHAFSLQKIKSWYYPHLYCLGAHAWLGSRDNVPGE